MSQYFKIHSATPQSHLMRQAVSIIRRGGVIVYPTDSGYALGCEIGNKEALERICSIRQLDRKHHFTLVCRNLSELGLYAKIDNATFRLLKAYTPGAYTFLLPATREVPRRLQHPKRKTIGLRIPDHVIAQTLLEMLDDPLMSTTLILPDREIPLIEPEAIYDILGKQVDLIIDGGTCGQVQTTVIDLLGDKPKVVRVGKGDITPFS